MKKFVFSVYSDTVFVAFVAFLLSFALFRFYLRSFALSLALALVTALALSALAFLHMRRKSDKKLLKLSDEREISKLAFHLAMDTEENNLERLFAALFEKDDKAQRADDSVVVGNEEYFFSFRLEPVRADEIANLVRRGGDREKILLTADVTPDAEKLAAAFGIRIMRAADVYLLYKETEQLPENYILAEKMKTGWKEKLKFRFQKRMYKGYLLAGAALLVFSLFTFFPVYYLVAGGILLSLAVAVRFFGTT